MLPIVVSCLLDFTPISFSLSIFSRYLLVCLLKYRVSEISKLVKISMDLSFGLYWKLSVL